MAKLKPCPFCGGEASVYFSGKRCEDYWKGYIIVKCTTCGAKTRGSFYWGEPIDWPLEYTVGEECQEKLWNRRFEHA